MDEPGFWGMVWLVIAGAAGIGEILSAGSFMLLPFAAGALGASLLSFLGVPPVVTWLVFLAASFVTFLALRPLARRMNAEESPARVGANRLVGEQGVVLTTIPGGPAELGMVRIHREQWRAESIDRRPLEPGTPSEWWT